MPDGDCTFSFSNARTVGRSSGSSACIRRSTGRTNISNDTNAETGLPGKVKIGVLSGPTNPKPWGMPGCMATFSNATLPMRPRASFTTS